MSFILPLPRTVLESTKIILLPQLSSKEQLLKAMPKYFNSGPKLFDCFIPLIGKQGELLLSPFLGHVGISTILDQLLLQSKVKIDSYFFGTCGAFAGSNLQVGSLVSPDSFYIEEKLSEIDNVILGESTHRILSTSFLSSESSSKFNYLNMDLGITLVDMEVSFIKRVCQHRSSLLISNLLVTDLWDSTCPSPSPKAIRSLSSYSDFMNLIIRTCD